MQLDGRYQRKDKTLDLMVRSHRAFDDAIRNGIRQRFHDVTEAGGIKGKLPSTSPNASSLIPRL